MDKTTLQRNEQVPVKGSYDVIVVGGGIAGVAAAMAAARQGSKTLLVEKSVMLGGLATLGYVVIYLPLCDGEGRRMIGGIGEELLLLSIENSYDTLPDSWRGRPARAVGAGRYRTAFNGPAFTLRLDNAVLESGAELLLDTLFCGVEMDAGRVTHLLFENKDGRVAYACKAVVDATGDAMVFAAAGAETKAGGNYLTYWGYYTDLRSTEDACATRNVNTAVKLLTLGADCNGKGQPTDFEIAGGLTAQEVNRFVLRGRQEALAWLAQKDTRNVALTGLPGMPQFRTTRMICGAKNFRYADADVHLEDSIGCCGDWRRAGMRFELPYGSLHTTGLRNVLAAGRIIGCEEREAWEVARVIPVAAMTGEAAGIAAALSGADVAATDIRLLQQEMAKGGTIIHVVDK